MANNQKNQMIMDYIKQFYPYIILFALMLFMHSFMGLFGDDIGYRNANIFPLINYISVKWNTWTSRILIIIVLSIIAKLNLYVWYILDSVIFTAGAYYAVKLINKNKNFVIVILGVLVFLMYPYVELDSAGWLATTLDYSWAGILGLLSFIPLINRSYNKPTSIVEYIFSIIALIYAANQEQCALIIIGINLLYLLNCIIHNEQINKYNLFAIVIAAVEFILFLKCPGVSARYAAEVATWYPTFGSLGIIEKLYLGTLPTIHILLRDKLIFVLFYMLLCICSILKTKNKYLKIFSILNILFILSITVLQPYFISIPEIHQIFTILGQGSIAPLTDTYTLIAISLCVYLLVFSCFMLYEIFDKNLFHPILFIAGFMSRLIIGFSPTVFASQQRTFFPFYLILMLLILMLSKKLFEDNKLDEHGEIIIIASFILLALFNYFNILLTISR